MKKLSFFAFLLIFFLISSLAFVAGDNEQGTAAPLRITVIVDNTSAAPGLQNDWGFSCLVEGLEKTILFDTGNKPDIFVANLEKLKIDLGRVQVTVISHPHYDHTGGLLSLLSARPGLPLFLPYSTPSGVVDRMKVAGATLEMVKEPRLLCSHTVLTGESDRAIIPEQSLVINTARGLIIITGCSHQGIVAILEQARTLYKRPIYMVLGGFHLLRHTRPEVIQIIARFKELGVERCGTTHCTGENVIPLFREAFGKNFIEMGVGRVIEIR